MAEYKSFGTVLEDVDHQTLNDNRDWIEASLRLYKANHGTVPTEDDLSDYDGASFRAKVADYGLKQMAGFNFNIVDQAIDTHTITQKADQKTKEAFVYMLDQYDQVNTSWRTTGDAAWEMFTDATNWLGLITLGTGTVVSQGAKLAGKEIVKRKVKNQVKQSLGRTGMLAGLEGAAHGAAYDTMDQAVRVDAGSQEEFSAGSVAASATVGLVAGATIGVGIDVVGAKLGARKARKAFEAKGKQEKKLADEAAEEATIDADAQTKNTYDPTDDQAAWIVELEARRAAHRADEPDVEARIKGDDAVDSPNPDRFTGQKFGGLVLRDARDLVTVKPENVIDEVRSNANFDADVLERFEGLELPRREFSVLVDSFNAARQHFNEIDFRLTEIIDDPSVDAARKAMAKEARDNNEVFLIRANAGATHVNSYSGRDLQKVQNYPILKPDPKTGKVTPEARALFHEKVQLKQLKDVHEKYDPEIDKLLSSDKDGDFQKGIELTRKRDAEADLIRAKIAEGSPEGNYDKVSKAAEKWVEASISGVFSPSTVIINTVFPMLKNYTYPLLDQIINNPLSLRGWQKTVRVYGHMFAATAAARKSFVAAWEFEQTLLTKDVSRFLGEGIKNKGRLASYMRVFPRLLGSTDAYNQEVAAAGYLAGEMFDELIQEGMKNKLKGKELKKFIDDNMEKRITEAYDEKITLESLTPLYEKGRALKLEGEALDKYVIDNVEKFGSKTLRRLGNTSKIKDLEGQANKLLQDGKRKEANVLFKQADELKKKGDDTREYVETLLYKRQFETGKSGIAGAIEEGAKKVEDFHKSHPLAKIFGQLFFRTPAWVFHESVRLTPAINVMLPQFRNDLAGKNGMARQARAQTEATLAFSLMMYVTTKWAQGEIKGSANRDYTMTGEQERGDLGALSIELGDEGKVFEYKRYEPLRIPMTIVVNALDGVMATRERERVGEADPDMVDRTKAAFGIGMATFISAFQDSALFTGIVDTVTAGSRAVGAFTSDDPNSREEAWNVGTDLAMKKALMIVPSTFKKTQVALGDNELTAPLNGQQRLLATFSPNHPSLPRKYDIFGNVRQLDNPLTTLNPFWYSTKEQRVAGRSKKEMEVIEWIDDLEQAGYGNFTRAKFKTSKIDVEDLREVQIEYDGLEISVYDAMMVELNKPKLKNKLVSELHRWSKSKLSLGNPEEPRLHGEPVKEAKRILSKYKEQALDNILKSKRKVVGEDKEVRDFLLELQNKINNAQRGIFK